MLSLEDIERIKADLSTFALTGTQVLVTTGGGEGTSFSWQHGKTEKSVRLRYNSSTGTIEALVNDAWISYLDFLASEDMGDLRFLARRTLNLTPETRPYVPVQIKAEDTPEDTHEAVGLLQNKINEALRAREQRTYILFLRGEAGGGKSVSLREFARRQAQDFLDGKTNTLGLYVDAQGKALLSLHEAFSSVLHDLAVTSIRKDTVATLCRNGLIVPLVDGFDELLGSGGFGDAFNSLGAFLADLHGQGAMVASGRSTFYDQQHLQITASRYLDEIDYRTETAEVISWSEPEIITYCRQAWESSENSNLSELLKKLRLFLTTEEHRKLLGKPFFVSQIAKLMADEALNTDEPIFSQVVAGFIAREASKWLDTQKKPILTTDEHLAFLEELAEEMWLSGTRELDSDTVRTVAEVIAERLPLEKRRIAIEKSVTHGFLDSGNRQNVRLRFQHQVYFDFLLQARISKVINKGNAESIRLFLEKGVLSEGCLEFFSTQHQHSAPDEISHICNSICSGMKSGGRFHVARQNGGALIAFILDRRTVLPVGMSLQSLDFQKVNIRDAILQEPTFQDCNFENVRLNGTRFIDARFSNCKLDRVAVDGSTRIDAELQPSLDVLSLVVDDGIPIYDPSRLTKALQSVGARLPSPEPETPISELQKRRIDSLDAFLVKMRRNLYLSIDLEKQWGFNSNQDWDFVKDLLLQTGILTTKKVQRKGPVGELWVLTRTPEEIRRGQGRGPLIDPAVSSFWDELMSN